ncbi:MAG: redoxin domain-containing protein [Proteobacteria bacterium]|nr:redoxin domain-containing protein [Pseudomonadota bacterium]
MAINSSAPGKQGHGQELNLEFKAKWKMEHPILLDESGDVGHLYGAKTTPQMFIIDAEGVVVYQGAIDN